MLNKNTKHPILKYQTVSEANLVTTNAPLDAPRLKVKDKKPLIKLWIACSCLPQPENPAIWSAYRERAASLSRAEWFGSLCVNTHEEELLTKQRFKGGDKELRSEGAALLRRLAELRCAHASTHAQARTKPKLRAVCVCVCVCSEGGGGGGTRSLRPFT